jgi:tetratricopeptide (TPR) repeat protein
VPARSFADEAAARNQRIAFFEQRLAADPIDFVSLNALAFDYLQRAREAGDIADYQRAELAASRSVELLPRDNYNGLTAMAALRLAQHDFAAAAELAVAATAASPGKAAAYGILGDAQIGLGDYDGAAAAYGRMLDIEPALPALSRQADLAWLQGETLDAADFWRQALAFDDGLPIENQAWAYSQLGRMSFAQGDLGAAQEHYERSFDLMPGYVHALAGLGSVAAAEGDWNAAIEHYVAAQERLPLPEYVAALGDVYDRAGRLAVAGDQYALVDAIDSLYRANGIDTERQLALFYADHDRELERALAMAERAYAAGRGIYAADTLAWALFKNVRADEAATLSEEALRLGTPDPLLHYHAAQIRYALGDFDGARAHLDRVFALNPDFSVLHAPDVRELRAALAAKGQ